MSVDAHVARCARQALALSVWDVLLGFWVAILLCHAKVDDVDKVCVFSAWSANKKIVGLDISIDQVLFVNCLDSSKLCNDSDLIRNGRNVGPSAWQS